MRMTPMEAIQETAEGLRDAGLLCPTAHANLLNPNHQYWKVISDEEDPSYGFIVGEPGRHYGTIAGPYLSLDTAQHIVKLHNDWWFDVRESVLGCGFSPPKV